MKSSSSSSKSILLILFSIIILISFLSSFFFFDNSEINLIVLNPEITNSAHHLHPWLATTISLLFLGAIVFMILLCGNSVG